MYSLSVRVRNFLAGEEAATSVEYAVMLGLILAAVIAAIGTVGNQTGGLWGTIDSDISAAGVGS